MGTLSPQPRPPRRTVALAAATALTASCRAPDALGSADRPPAVRVAARFATQPVPVNEVDDAAIWVHPTDPDRSLILVGNETRGLEVHDLDGVLLKHLDVDARVNHVDVVTGFEGFGAPADLVLASCIGESTRGVRAWRIDVATAKLETIPVEGGASVLAGDRLLGLCAGRSPRDGRIHVFVTSGTGAVEQHELRVAGSGIALHRVRAWKLGSKTEGCVVDPARGVVFLAEEDVGVWRFPVEPDAEPRGVLIVRVGEHGLSADVEGLALVEEADGRGYLVVVGQGPKGGASTLAFYERDGEQTFAALVEPTDRDGHPVDRASGVAVTNRPLGTRFPRGLLLVGDRTNDSGSEDFEAIDWAELARAAGLRVGRPPP